ncbi:hypothetical protein CRUP_013427 [Coryphaenoides rupestris]|nr:hypothetical protein CRUP_013427 [Coryphaenoides rupestris]
MNMRQSKRLRSRSPGLWLHEHSWEERVDGRKRRKRDSHSSERENKSRQQHSHYRAYDGHYLETRSLNQRMASRDRRSYRDASGAMAYEDSRGATCRTYRDRDRDWNHYSKSSCRSGRSGRSGRSRRSRSRRRGGEDIRGRRRSPSHHSSYSRRSQRRRKRSRSVEDDGEGHLIYHIGDMLRARYEIMSTLGEGAFGKVVECIDHSNGGARLALKIIKNIDRYREAAMSEVEVLEQMNSLDYDRIYPCVRMLDWFDYHGHVCIAFELLGLSTYDFLKENNFQPFPIGNIQHMAYQIIRAVKFLHKNKLTHTDLKPENILFIDSEYDIEYSPLLTHDSKEHLAMMERILGPIPTNLLQKTRQLDWDANGSSGRFVKKTCKPLKEYMMCQSEEHQKLFDLVEKMMEYDPAKRLSLEQALRHPFLAPFHKGGGSGNNKKS